MCTENPVSTSFRQYSQIRDLHIPHNVYNKNPLPLRAADIPNPHSLLRTNAERLLALCDPRWTQIPEYGCAGGRGGYEVVGGAVLVESCGPEDGAFLVCVTQLVEVDGLPLPSTIVSLL